MEAKFKEALINPETGEVRVTFLLTGRDDLFLVVKFFDQVQKENYTFKFFSGMYEKVKSHWRSLEPMNDDEGKSIAADAVQVCLKIISEIKEIQGFRV